MLRFGNNRSAQEVLSNICKSINVTITTSLRSNSRKKSFKLSRMDLFVKEDFDEALAKIKEKIIKTPLEHSKFLSDKSEGKVYLKCENEQKTGSFKVSNTIFYYHSYNKAIISYFYESFRRTSENEPVLIRDSRNNEPAIPVSLISMSQKLQKTQSFCKLCHIM